MSTLSFDTLAYAKRLRAAGFSEHQAEALKPNSLMNAWQQNAISRNLSTA